MAANKFYSIFSFVKLLNRVKNLEQNEKVALKQAFEDNIAGCQEKVFLRTYFISNLKEDCDILFWRMSNSLDFLQSTCAKSFSSGIGKYMEIKYSYIGVKDFDTDSIEEMNKKLGIYPYFLLHPLTKSQKWYELSEEERNNIFRERENILNKNEGVIENIFISYGIDDQDMIVTRESKSLEKLIEVTYKLKELKNKSYTVNDKPVFLCIGKDLREILDNIV